MSSVHGGKIVWCLLSTVAKKCGVFCSPWQKGVVSFVHPGKKCLVSFGSGVFCPAPRFFHGEEKDDEFDGRNLAMLQRLLVYSKNMSISFHK